MLSVRQSPTDPEFVQNPYPFYDKLRSLDPLALWEDYDFPVASSHKLVSEVLRDRRFGRENPYPPAIPDRLKPFYAVEEHSMLELEPPRHTRLRGLVLRAFTSRRIKELGPEIESLSHRLIDDFPAGDFDLLQHFAQRLPVIIIARLLGVPEAKSKDLLVWSNAMVMMYQAGRTQAQEDTAAKAAQEFSEYLHGYVETRRSDPKDDLITHLIQAEEDGEKLTTQELITTCILLLNAGHEATVHTLGNGVKVALETGLRPTDPEKFCEEILRYDPPLHMFTRYALEDLDLCDHHFKKGSEIGLLLGAANRDPEVYPNPNSFDPDRDSAVHTSFGAGLHFCVGAPLARLELQIGLSTLFERCPDLKLATKPSYSSTYHFHGLQSLMVST